MNGSISSPIAFVGRLDPENAFDPELFHTPSDVIECSEHFVLGLWMQDLMNVVRSFDVWPDESIER